MLAVVTLTAAYGVFDEAFEGELWTVIDEITSGATGSPNGVVYVGGTLFVADDQQRTVTAYDSSGAVIDLPLADWQPTQTVVPLSPVYGWAPNQLTTATVRINDGADQTAILVSDGNATRALAFDTKGRYLFTIVLDRPLASPEKGSVINGLAMGPGAKFVLKTTTNELALQGSFAASWADDFGFGVDGAVLVYRNLPFQPRGQLQFYADPVAELKGTEGTTTAPAAREPYGVTFDPQGNLYTVDAVTERLNAYAPDLTHLFNFGTPAGDGTAEFYQSFGMTYSGGRLFIADAINNRVVVYRPNLSTKTLDFLFEIDGLGALDGFPFSVAIDPLTGRLAVTDDYGPRVWILQTPSLAVFDLQVLDNNRNPVEVVCSGDAYQVRFSITVPAGRTAVAGVEPQLKIDGVKWTTAAPTPDGTYPSTPLQAGQVVTYTYSLTAPGNLFVGEIDFEAGATATTPVDILFRQAVLRVSDCQSAPPTITANPSVVPQLSGWTPVFTGDTYTIRLLAEDDEGIQQIEYKLTGANQPPRIDPVEYDGASSPQHSDVELVEMGDTRIEFRAWDNDFLPSPWQVLDVRLVRVPHLYSDEGASVSTSIGDPINVAGIKFSATGLPSGLTINSSTGLITGTLGYDAAGVHAVVVTEKKGAASTSVTFSWTVTNVNRPPVARNDSYSTAGNTPLIVPAPGVLGNDSDADADPLTAILVTGPSHGTLALNANGSFVYTPAATYSGIDTFIYKANDSTAGSLNATVTITVVKSNLPQVCTAAVTPAVIWPVNHKEVYLSLSGIKGPVSGALSIRFTSILQDEPTDSVGQGNTMQDGGIEAGGLRAWVRAERSGSNKVPGDGRVYLVGFEATGAGGLSCTGTVNVGVPHDQGKGPAVLSRGRWNSITGQLVSAP